MSLLAPSFEPIMKTTPKYSTMDPDVSFVLSALGGFLVWGAVMRRRLERVELAGRLTAAKRRVP